MPALAAASSALEPIDVYARVHEVLGGHALLFNSHLLGMYVS